MSRVPTVILGGTGYVAGELLRLVAGHPQLELKAILSDSQPGAAAADFFPHLRSAFPHLKFSSLADVRQLVAAQPDVAVLGAAPHGVAAALIDDLLTAAATQGAQPRVIDISADFRYRSAAAYEAVYKHPHGAPQRLAEFTCAVPEHLKALPTRHVAHPGCFATAILLAAVPLLQMGLVEPRFYISGMTGSTGSGRTPAPGTHHPQRHSDLYAYNPLAHRHAPEIAALAAAATGVAACFQFVPHSGPFARGIHITLQAQPTQSITAAALRDALRDFYSGSPFVRVGDAMPHIKDVTASNYAHLGVAADDGGIAIMCAIDNLVKGAAGGAVQWLNRIYGFDESMGLTAPAPGWT